MTSEEPSAQASPVPPVKLDTLLSQEEPSAQALLPHEEPSSPDARERQLSTPVDADMSPTTPKPVVIVEGFLVSCFALRLPLA